jgi:hypothetical protein
MERGLQYLSTGAYTLGAVAAAVIGATLLVKQVSPGAPQLLPAEYVYLDVSRVDAYLGQLDNGLSSSEKQALNHTHTTNTTVNLGQAISIGASGTGGESSERTVTPSEGDRFYQLLTQLKATFAHEPNELDMSKPTSVTEDAERISAGEFIEISHAKLLLPPFALAIPKLSFGEQAPINNWKPVSREAVVRLIAHHPADVKAYLKRFGRNPRFLLTIKGRATGKEKPLTVFIPIRYGDLVNTVSLVGDSLTVVGKVILQVKEREKTGQGKPLKPAYYDDEAALTYKSALLRIPDDVKRVLDLPRDRTKLVKESVGAEEPVMVVLPVGIYS